MEIRKNDAAKVAAFKAQKVVRVPSAEGQYAPRAVQDAAARVALGQIQSMSRDTANPPTPDVEAVVAIMCEATSHFILPEYAREALDALAEHGYVIVHPDDVDDHSG